MPSEFSFKLPEESWWLPTQPPMDVSAEQPGLGSSPPGPQLELHLLAPLSLSCVSLSPPPLSFFISFPPSRPFLVFSCPPFPLPLLPPFFLSVLAGRSRHPLLHLWGRRRKKIERGSHHYKVTERGLKERGRRKREERTKEKWY